MASAGCGLLCLCLRVCCLGYITFVCLIYLQGDGGVFVLVTLLVVFFAFDVGWLAWFVLGLFGVGIVSVVVISLFWFVW